LGKLRGLLERPRCRWEDNIIVYHREIGFGSVDWIQLAQDGDVCWALVNMVMNLVSFTKGGEFLD
jgi:hypothetical protein